MKRSRFVVILIKHGGTLTAWWSSAALAHTNPDKTEAAYARSDLFVRRRTLMDKWAAYLTEERGMVVPLMRA